MVYIRVVFLKLGEIDTANEKFSADAFIQARWREPGLDGEGIVSIRPGQFAGTQPRRRGKSKYSSSPYSGTQPRRRGNIIYSSRSDGGNPA